MKPIATGLFIFIFLVTGFAFGHSGATGVVKERMDAMAEMGDKTKLVADMFKGKRALDKNVVADAADSYTKHGSRISELFPDTKESRTGSNTEALPSIWEDREEFNSQVTDFVELSNAFKNTVLISDDVEQMKKAFLQMTKSCSGCHKQFRQRKG